MAHVCEHNEGGSAIGVIIIIISSSSSIKCVGDSVAVVVLVVVIGVKWIHLDPKSAVAVR